MEYIILIICILSIFLDYLKNKKIYSPAIVFNTIFFVTLGLYLLRFSNFQQLLSYRTKILFLSNVLAFNITYFLCFFLKWKLIKKWNLKFKFKGLHLDKEKKLMIARRIVILIFLIEVIYSKGFPLLWKLTGSPKTYFDFGIPSVHGAFNGLVICLGAYTLFKKRNDKFLYLAIGILIISRQIIMSMILEAVLFHFISTKFEKKHLKKYIIIGIIFILMFNVIGNFRSGSGTMDNVFQPREEYEKIPDSLKWIYSYMTFSVSNFNNLVSITDGGVNHGVSMASTLVPTVLLNIVHIEPKYNPYYLISPNYNTSTSFTEVYLDFGIYGIIGYGIFLALLGFFLFQQISKTSLESSQLIYSVYIHNILLMFFINMFLYLPVIIQIVYILLLLYENKEGKKENLNEEQVGTSHLSSRDLISVIVPVYNVEAYLKRCVESIVNQTYKNLEIILVNDGSLDQCGEICDAYAKKDSRIKVIHKENGGVSEARNMGINQTTGRYIVFVDADDYIEEDMIEKLYSAIVKYNADIVCCAQFVEKKKKRKIQNDGLEFCEDAEQILGRMLLFDNIDTGPCGKIYRLSLFDNIRYPIGKRYEDMGTTYKLFDKSKKIVHISYVGYHYVMHKESFMHKKFHKEHIDSLYFSKEIHEFVCKKYPSLAKKSEAYYSLAIVSILQKIKSSDNFFEYKKEYREIKNLFDKIILNMLKNNYIPKVKKVMIICVYFNQYWIISTMKKCLGKEW